MRWPRRPEQERTCISFWLQCLGQEGDTESEGVRRRFVLPPMIISYYICYTLSTIIVALYYKGTSDEEVERRIRGVEEGRVYKQKECCLRLLYTRYEKEVSGEDYNRSRGFSLRKKECRPPVIINQASCLLSYATSTPPPALLFKKRHRPFRITLRRLTPIYCMVAVGVITLLYIILVEG